MRTRRPGVSCLGYKIVPLARAGERAGRHAATESLLPGDVLDDEEQADDEHDGPGQAADGASGSRSRVQNGLRESAE